jgi:hypothetical protein
MGLSVLLVTESGEVVDSPVHDTSNVLGRVLPRSPGGRFSQLPYIDPYGDTTFNRLQMEPLLAEWILLPRDGLNPPDAAVLDAIERLAARCRDEVHLYLKFVGD